ncbi:hypothetical protein [Natronobacterium gregoryi]|uniref:Uncharacterized protein n=2 Tax=Natronobacterium gregoryi TaxID=44930 RepID=L0AJ33_NATGS|nr:hypothetical protein [Natronobacterium gregoryi]AFZ73913.1 hypothetical protein Natgr_2768 [Natronobacterium gregoryi SP2]ELY71565.1 hypothetical protein C490_04922 [Natronobacterium gregoryi SP2]PLK19056.1 hypothetical protein CYV19_16850 [Natronobacterium gregoryi SP2]SFJ63040.1 hypothetical protein SAMN05443661_1499 [Natronobacterium gregoryi]
MDTLNELSLWCIIATGLLAFYVLTGPIMLVFVIALGAVALVGVTLVYSVPADRRIVVGTITGVGVLTAGAVLPLAVQEIAHRWDLGSEIVISLTAAGAIGTLGLSLESLRRVLPENDRN